MTGVGETPGSMFARRLSLLRDVMNSKSSLVKSPFFQFAFDSSMAKNQNGPDMSWRLIAALSLPSVAWCRSVKGRVVVLEEESA